MEIYLVRHTQVGVEKGTCYGQTDVPLADSFAEEFEVVRRKLPELGSYVIYSSPLGRCRILAEKLNSNPVKLDPRLMELDFGIWEMQCWDDIGAGDVRAWTADFVNQCCPGGESYRDQFQRTVAFWEDWSRSPRNGVVVTHAGVIRALLAHLLSIPLEKSLWIGVDYGSVTKIHLLEEVPSIDYINR